jgi:hypothetical protein
MALVIVIVLVAIIAFAMYDTISPKLPKQYQLGNGPTGPGGKGALTAGQDGTEGQTSHNNVPTERPATAAHWQLAMDGVNSRLARAFNGVIHGNARDYDAPVAYVSCYQGHLFAWLDTRLRTANASGNPGFVTVAVNGGSPELWARQQEQAIAVPYPDRFVAMLAAEQPLKVTLSFGEAPTQTLTLTTEGFGTIAGAINACKH